MSTPPARFVLAALATMLVAGCGVEQESPRTADVPVIDIAQLPDIDQATDQMLDLIEQVRAEVSRLVPATAPWKWAGEQLGMSCVQEKTDRKGVMRGLRDLKSDHALSDDEWDRVYPAVHQLAVDAGLKNAPATPNSPDAHDARFNSDDGRTLILRSRDGTMITGNVACRISADGK